MVMMCSGDAIVAFAATTSTTKGGEDITNPESELDSLSDTNDESQGSKSDKNAEGQNSEEQHSNEDVASTSATDSEMEYDEQHSTDPEEEIRNGNFQRKCEFRSYFKTASSTVRCKVFRLRKENKGLRGQICDSMMKYNQSEKFSRTQRRTYQDEIKGLIDVQDDFFSVSWSYNRTPTF
jgi:hypothetical protein